MTVEEKKLAAKNEKESLMNKILMRQKRNEFAPEILQQKTLKQLKAIHERIVHG